MHNDNLNNSGSDGRYGHDSNHHESPWAILRSLVCAFLSTILVVADKVPGTYGIAALVAIAAPSVVHSLVSLKKLK